MVSPILKNIYNVCHITHLHDFKDCNLALIILDMPTSNMLQ